MVKSFETLIEILDISFCFDLSAIKLSIAIAIFLIKFVFRLIIIAEPLVAYSGIPPESVVIIGKLQVKDSIIVKGAGSSHIEGKTAISAN